MTQQYVNPQRPLEMPRTHTQGAERPLGDIVAELWENTEKLVRQELQLASAELDQKVERVKTDVTQATIGGAVLYAGLLGVLASVILLLSKVVDPWLASLIVGLVVSGGGYALIQRGKKDLERADLAPTQTVHSVKRTAHTLKESVK